MRALFATIALCGVVASASAFAQGRPNSVNMTCAQARGAVASAGALVLGTGGATYDRYVSNRSFCTPSEVTDPGFAPTVDNPQCLVGYLCVERTSRGQDER